MKYFGEKEKKLEIALDKLKKLNFLDEEGQKNLEFLSNQKNQLEIEKKEEQFSEKIDELNQETDNLIEEIDKWQM